MTTRCIGEICSFNKGTSVPRDRMHNSGEYRYLHYGDLYKGHDLYIDIDRPQKQIPYISHTERIKRDQFVNDGDIVYVLTSETIEDLGKAFLVSNPNNYLVVAGTETTIMRVTDTDLVYPAWLNYLIQTKSFKKKLRQYTTGMKVFRVHPRDVSRIEIDVPTMQEQKNIVYLLDAYYQKIRLNNRINDYLAA